MALTNWTTEMWHLADALGHVIETDGFTFKCDPAHIVSFGDPPLKVVVPMKIVSGHRCGDGIVVLVRTLGNLGLWLGTGVERVNGVTCFLVDFAKLDNVEGLFESKKPATVAKAKELVSPAIVAGFDKASMTTWKRRAVP